MKALLCTRSLCCPAVFGSGHVLERQVTNPLCCNSGTTPHSSFTKSPHLSFTLHLLTPLQEYEAALACCPGHIDALWREGQALVALGQRKVRGRRWLHWASKK